MYQRLMKNELCQMAREYPVVTLIGPRQAGKTTLVRDAFPDKPYFNLELPDLRALVETDPHAFLQRCQSGAIIDEVQRVPELLSYIQVLVDEQQKNGAFILTGSHQLDLHQRITQSLAGRTALLTLLPLSFKELNVSKKSDADQLMFQGFMPRIHSEQQTPSKAYSNYLHTYVERDVRNMVNIKDLSAFQKFLTLCASRVGQLINYDDLSREAGVSNNTVKNWLSILEASFITLRLQPYHANISKRLVKTPKLYFIETGLAAFLLGIEHQDQLARDPLRGQLFENMVVVDLIKQRLNQGLAPNLFFYRDQQNHEVDAVFKRGRELVPIEIKSSQTFNKQFLKQIDYLTALFPSQITQSYVIYAGQQEQRLKQTELIHFFNASEILSG